MIYILHSGGSSKVAAVAYTLEHQGVPTTMVHMDDMDSITPPAGSLVLGLGGLVLGWMTSRKIVPKRAISTLRGRAVEHDGVQWMITYHPLSVDTDYRKGSYISSDIQLALRWATTGTFQPETGDYRYVDDFSELVARVELNHTQTGKRQRVSCDLETIGMSPWVEGVWIVSIAATDRVGYGDVVKLTKDTQPQEGSILFEQIKYLLCDGDVGIVGANFKFDMSWIALHWGITPTNLIFDTTIVGSLLDENRSNSLEMHAYAYTTMGGYDAEMNDKTKWDKGRMDLIPDEVLLPYAAGDVDACLRVYHELRRRLLQTDYLAHFYKKIMNHSVAAFHNMEMNGVYCDAREQLALYYTLESTRDSLEQEMLGMIPIAIRLKWGADFKLVPKVLVDYFFGARGLNLEPRMYTTVTQKPSTAQEHFSMFGDVPEAAKFCALYKEWGSAGKTLQTYVVGFTKHLHADSYYHPSYLLLKGEWGGQDDAGANTGRTSAKDPAIQTIPKHTIWAKPLRKVYIAPKGYSIVNCDYAAGELRVAADIANEDRMLYAFNNGIDLHRLTASAMLGISLEEFLLLPPDIQASNRQGAKAGNFGLLYGMGVGGYMAYAANSYGVILTEQVAYEQRERFFETYPKLRPWHNRTKAFARNNGYVVSPLGRVRHLPMIHSKDPMVASKQERNAVNSPVQGTLSDLTQYAMARLYEEYRGCGIRMCLMCHDCITSYVPVGEEVAWAKVVAGTMRSLPLEAEFGWKPKVIFEAEAEIGENMAEMEEVPLSFE